MKIVYQQQLSDHITTVLQGMVTDGAELPSAPIDEIAEAMTKAANAAFDGKSFPAPVAWMASVAIAAMAVSAFALFAMFVVATHNHL